MQLKHLATVGFTSALLFTNVKIAIAIPHSATNITEQSTLLIANETATTNVIAEGNFTTVEQDHPTEGKAQIIEENGQKYLQFDANFTTAQGPDVQVVLHRNASVAVNLDEADYIVIAALQSFDGSQKYLLPEDLNLEEYQSVAIWCQQFNVTFGYANF